MYTISSNLTQFHLPLSFSVSLCLFVSVSVYVAAYVSVSVSVCICLSVCRAGLSLRGAHAKFIGGPLSPSHPIPLLHFLNTDWLQYVNNTLYSISSQLVVYHLFQEINCCGND